MAFDLLFLIIGFAFIYWGSHYLINAVVFLSHKLGISSLIIGLTIVAFGTSTPELFVGVWSALKDEAILSLGNVIGANLANIGLIVGIVTVVHPMKIRMSTLKKEFPFVVLAPVILYLLSMDGMLTRLDGIILLIMAFLFIYYAVWSAGQRSNGFFNRVKLAVQDGDGKAEVVKQSFNLILGLILLFLGARFIVNSGIDIARSFGISEVIIGITLITIGTALPELFTSITALIRKNTEISMGNVIGSTIFNIFFILGIVLLISPIAVPQNLINFDLLILILFTLILITLLRTSDRIARIEGAILLVAYFSYIGYLYFIS